MDNMLTVETIKAIYLGCGGYSVDFIVRFPLKGHEFTQEVLSNSEERSQSATGYCRAQLNR